MLKASKVRLYPSAEQCEFLHAQFGAVRFVYNKALDLKSPFYQRHGVNLSPKKDLKPLLAVAKKSRKYAWLKHYDSIALQQAVINLDTAFSRFFNKKHPGRFPRFKRRHGPIQDLLPVPAQARRYALEPAPLDLPVWRSA